MMNESFTTPAHTYKCTRMRIRYGKLHLGECWPCFECQLYAEISYLEEICPFLAGDDTYVCGVLYWNS